MDHLTVGSNIWNIESHGAFHAVQIIIEAGLSVHKQGSGDAVQVQTDSEAVLKFQVDQFNGALQFVVGQRHPITGGDHDFTHRIRPFLHII